MQRVMIVGGPGSGKSTLARLMGGAAGLPVFHMDKIQHLAAWKPRPLAEKIQMAHAIEAGAQWIFEGGLTSTYDNRTARADTLIWLDLPVALRLWRVLYRIWAHYGQQRPDMAKGCTETVGAHTLEFMVWIIRTRRSQRNKIARLVELNRDRLHIHHLKSRRDVAAFIATLDRPSANA